MLKSFIVLPLMMVLSVLQMSAISRITLINGSADLILLAVIAWGVNDRGKDVYLWALIGGLMISFVTAMPMFTPIVPYIFAAFVARFFHGRVWQAPILSIIMVVFISTLFQHFFYLVMLGINGVTLGFFESLQKVTLPSLLLNFFFLFPLYVIISDIGKWVIPEGSYE